MPGLRIHTITIAAQNPSLLARFWMTMLDYVVMPNHTESVQIGDPAGAGPTLLFAPADISGFGRDRFHLDLRPVDQGAALEAALQHGATRLDTPAEASWIRLADPEGNRFCLLQSEADAHAFESSHGPGTPSL